MVRYFLERHDRLNKLQYIIRLNKLQYIKTSFKTIIMYPYI